MELLRAEKLFLQNPHSFELNRVGVKSGMVWTGCRATHPNRNKAVMSGNAIRAHSHFPGWRFNPLICQDISFCINRWWLNEINGLHDGPGKWECALQSWY